MSASQLMSPVDNISLLFYRFVNRPPHGARAHGPERRVLDLNQGIGDHETSLLRRTKNDASRRVKSILQPLPARAYFGEDGLGSGLLRVSPCPRARAQVLTETTPETHCSEAALTLRRHSAWLPTSAGARRLRADA
jgi:hypothetical protein